MTRGSCLIKNLVTQILWDCPCRNIAIASEQYVYTVIEITFFCTKQQILLQLVRHNCLGGSSVCFGSIETLCFGIEEKQPKQTEKNEKKREKNEKNEKQEKTNKNEKTGKTLHFL